MWCYRYYFRNLCDEIRFLNWFIVEYVEFFQLLLVMWREELIRKSMDFFEEEVCKILEIFFEDLLVENGNNLYNFEVFDEVIILFKKIENIDEDKFKR